MDLAQATNWVQPTAAVLAMALASVGLLRARSCPWLLAFACWAALALCAAVGLVPAPAAALLAIAVAAAVFSHQLPAGLTWALFAWLVSVAAGWTVIGIGQVPGVSVPEVLCHTMAVLAAWWMLAAWLTRYWSDRWAAEARAAFSMTATTSAVAVLILLVYSAVTVTIWRLAPWGWEIRPRYLPGTAWQGLLDIALLGAALLWSRKVDHWSGRPVAALWLVIFAGVWYALRQPMASSLTYGIWPDWLTWLMWMQLSLALPLLGAVVAWIWRDWRAQARAWPHRLESLVRISRPWPGMEASVTAIGLVLVPLGLWHAFSTGAEAHQVTRLTTWEIAAAALALSAFVGWYWSRTVGELALALWTVSLAAFGATTALQLVASSGHVASMDQLPIVQTGAVLGLAAASLLWYWLASLWRQQLHNGQAWTTAGRLVPLANRMGFLAASLAVLVSTKLALWPRLQYGTADNSAARVLATSLIYFLLIAACLYAARQTRRPTHLYLACMAGSLWAVFLYLRW